jgi:hypothetical protein
MACSIDKRRSSEKRRSSGSSCVLTRIVRKVVPVRKGIAIIVSVVNCPKRRLRDTVVLGSWSCSFPSELCLTSWWNLVEQNQFNREKKKFESEPWKVNFTKKRVRYVQ